MGKINGADGIIEVTIAETDTKIGNLKTWNYDSSLAVGDATDLDDEGANHLPGLLSWTGTLECNANPDDDAQDAIIAAHFAKTGIAIKGYIGGKGTGLPLLSGNALVTNWNPSGGSVSGDAVTVSFSLTGQGVITRTKQTV